MKMKASENGKRSSYIPPFSRRKDFCGKVREAERKIKELKLEGSWVKVSRLMWVLRNAWWGYRRYPFK